MRSLLYSMPVWAVGLRQANTQQTNPAPPIPESGPSGSNSVAVLALWMVARRRQSGPRR